MKKLGGWLSLIASIIWCLLVIPVMISAAGAKIYATAYSFNSISSFIEYTLVVLSTLGIVALAVIIFKFGVDLIISSWKTARAIEPEPLNLIELSKKMKESNNTIMSEASNVAPVN